MLVYRKHLKMNNFDKIDTCIEELISLQAGDMFIVNEKWTCTMKNDGKEIKWEKDTNSPAMIASISIDANDGAENFEGIIAVQSDMSLSHKYYAEMCIKDCSSDTWQHMYTVVSIEFKR